MTALEGPENPFAAISEQLTRLYAQKDAAVETVLARLAPLEAKLGAVEARLGEPQALLDRFAERLEAVQARLAAVEDAENPFAAIAEQLTRLYAPEGRGGRDGVRAAGAAGGEARGDRRRQAGAIRRRRSTASRSCRHDERGGTGARPA